MINPVQIILAKREGKTLSSIEIENFVGDFVEGVIPEYQMSALLMAMFFNGLNTDEISALTNTYIHSGKSIDFGLDIITADKHSTGGVGDKISLMLAPIAAALGLYVPMISGRGLGHTGGTLDKLEAIPGFQTQYSVEEFKNLTLKHQLAMVGQSAELVPADKKIYALRDVTATVESIGLITASIMSKKIAEGAKHLVIDLKVGSGAFMPDMTKANELANSLISTGKAFGQKVTVVFSNMNSPLGYAVGNAVEVTEAIEYLKGKTLPDTKLLTDTLVSSMLLSAELAETSQAAVQMIENAISSGKALDKFREMVIAQGGNPEVIEHPELMGVAKYRLPIYAHTDGWIKSIDNRAIGYALINIKAGRKQVTDTIDYSTGAFLYAKIGTKLCVGDVIGEVLCNDESEGKKVAEMIRQAYTFSHNEHDLESLIISIK